MSRTTTKSLLLTNFRLKFVSQHLLWLNTEKSKLLFVKVFIKVKITYNLRGLTVSVLTFPCLFYFSQVFFRQLNPGIKYEYSIPTTSPGEAVPALVKYPTKVIGLESRRLDPSTGTLTQRDDPNPKPSLHHHRRQRVKRRFSWKITGLSACSKSCGGGKVY